MAEVAVQYPDAKFFFILAACDEADAAAWQSTYFSGLDNAIALSDPNGQDVYYSFFPGRPGHDGSLVLRRGSEVSKLDPSPTNAAISAALDVADAE